MHKTTLPLFGEGRTDGKVGLFVGVFCCWGWVAAPAPRPRSANEGTGIDEVAFVVFVLSEAVFDATIVIRSRGIS